MKNEFQIGEQTIKFVLLPAGDVWSGLLLLANEAYEVEIEAGKNGDITGQVNWDQVRQVLQFILNEFPSLLEKANKSLRYFVNECGLYSSIELEAIQQFELDFIELLYPVSSRMDFHLNFTLGPNPWIDTYGQWSVSFMRGYLVGVERKQL